MVCGPSPVLHVLAVTCCEYVQLSMVMVRAHYASMYNDKCICVQSTVLLP